MGVLDRVRATRAGHLSLKIAVALVGGAIVVLGLIMVPAPGPGWLVVIGGLSVLAIEYAWAKHALDFVRDRVRAWTYWIGARSLVFRAAVGSASLVLLAVGLWASLKYTLHFDVLRWAGERLRL
ncbi:MAG TPA: PGPGW domain-containing protein [Mycobacteriales bacterium]